MTSKNYDKVFISYAKEDIELASKLYDFLKAMCFEPWLDKKELLPGQDWDYEIRKALRNADFIILLLSKTSVEKRGYVQREYKLALQYCEEKLDSDIYIIPCKIDNCEVPYKLNKYQWTEFHHQEDTFYQILSSLNFQRQKYINASNLKNRENTPLEYEEKEIKLKIKEKLPQTDINISFPQFQHIENEDLLLLNSFIQNLIYPHYNIFKLYSSKNKFDDEEIVEMQNLHEYTKEDEEINIYKSNNTLDITYNFLLLSNELISFEIWNDSCTSWAFHGYRNVRGYNFSLNPLQKITIETLLDNRDDVLSYLHKECYNKLAEEAVEKELIANIKEDFLLDEELYSEKWDTFENFSLMKDSIIINFNPYQITAYSYGHFFPMFKFDELLFQFPNLRTLKIIKELASNANIVE